MLNRLLFSIDIAADKTKIWKAIWEDKYYRDWASIFFEGSYYEAKNLNEGSKIMFLGPDQNGIYSLIQTHIPEEIIKFKHIASVTNGKLQAIDDESKKWTGANEIYSLKEGLNSISLQVEIDVLDEHVEFMSSKLPLALEKIKKNCL